MAGDFVNEVFPLSQIRPVTPHPANVREERKRRKRKNQEGSKRQDKRRKDRVSLQGEGGVKPQPPKDQTSRPEYAKPLKKKRSIDIKI